MNWFDLVPYSVAQAQVTWEKRRAIRRATDAAGIDNPRPWQITEMSGLGSHAALMTAYHPPKERAPVLDWLEKINLDIQILTSNRPPKPAYQTTLRTDGMGRLYGGFERWKI